LKNHIKTHHLGISEFACTICESKYKHKKSLQEHMNKCHNNNNNNPPPAEASTEQIEQPEEIVLPPPQQQQQQETIFI